MVVVVSRDHVASDPRVGKRTCNSSGQPHAFERRVNLQSDPREGRAFITGRHEFLIDPDDDLCHGFILR